MSLLARVFGRVQPAPRHAGPLAAYRALPAVAADAPLGTVRIAVTDVETSGLDPHRDRLISIGAVAVIEGLVRFDDSFTAVLRQPSPSAASNILVHRIDAAAQLGGLEPADALAAWLTYAGKAPLAGFHADFDRVVLERAVRAAFGIELANVWLDLALIMPALFSSAPGLLRRPAPRNENTLDAWMQCFGIEAYARHDALSDALATAQLFQVALAEAERRGMRTLKALCRFERERRP